LQFAAGSLELLPTANCQLTAANCQLTGHPAASETTSQDFDAITSAALRAASDRRSASIELDGVGCLARSL
jgi:hypothetical protein